MSTVGLTASAASVHSGRLKFIVTVLLSTALPFLFAPLAASGPTTISYSVILVFTVLNSLHIGATFWFYFDPDFKEVRSNHPASFYTIPAGLLLTIPALYYALGPSKVYLIVLFQAWANYHYGKQNLGLFSLISLAEKKPPITPSEKRILIAVSWGGCLGASFLFLKVTGAQGVPTVVMSTLFYTGLVIQSAAIAAAVFIMARSPERFGPWKAVFFMVACGFFLSQYLFDSPLLTIGVYAWAHGLQYIIMVGLMSRPTSPSGWRFVGTAWLAILLLPAAFIFIGAHTQFTFLPSQTWIDLLLAANIAMVMAHFVVDAVAWRLREAPQRKYVFGRLNFLTR